MARSQKSFALLLTCSVACMAVVACGDDEDNIGGDTAGSSGSGGRAGSANGGSSGSDNGGSSSSGSSNGGSSSGTAGSSAGGGGTSSAGTNGGGTAGTDPGEGGEGGMPDGGGAGGTGEAGAPPVEGGAAGAAGTDAGGAGMGGEAGAGGGGGDGDGLRLAYTFDEGTGTVLGDSSGNGLNGTLTDATAWTAQGRNGAAMALSGAGGVTPTQYATVPAGVFGGAEAVTVAAWVKLSANPMWARLFDFSNALAGTATRFMYVALDSGGPLHSGLRFSYFGGTEANEAIVSTATVLPINVWKHLAVTMAEDGEQTIYIDGFPAAEATTVAIPPAQLEPLSAISYLGKSRFPDGGFTGAMDEFVVYDRVLSHKEIAVLAAPKGDYTRLAFEEAQGTTSQDSSDRNVDATLDGGASWTAGRMGAGVQVSGAGQYVTLNNPLAGCTTELSISLWVKHTAVNNWSRILDFGGVTDNFMFLTASGPEGKLFFTIKSGAKETPLTGTKGVPADNAWHHVAVVLTETVGSVYVDGEVSGNIASPVTLAEFGVTNEHWLGKSRFSDVDPYFNGAFDEVRIACRALTLDEVKNLAHQ